MRHCARGQPGEGGVVRSLRRSGLCRISLWCWSIGWKDRLATLPSASAAAVTTTGDSSGFEDEAAAMRAPHPAEMGLRAFALVAVAEGVSPHA